MKNTICSIVIGPWGFALRADFHLSLICEAVGSEKQRNAPERREAHKGIDYPAHSAGLAAADKGHNVETEKAHAAPVNSAYNSEYESYTIDYQSIFSFRRLWMYPVKALVSNIFLPF